MQAIREKSHLIAMKALIEANDECISELHTDKILTHAFSKGTVFIKAIEGEIKEIEKFMEGKPNNWE